MRSFVNERNQSKAAEVGWRKLSIYSGTLKSLPDGILVNSRFGRHHLEIVKREGMPIGQALAEISGLTIDKAVRLAEDQGLQQPLREYDQQDVHVWVTAIQERCTYMVSSNIKRFPEKIGQISRIRPGDFYHLITEGEL